MGIEQLSKYSQKIINFIDSLHLDLTKNKFQSHPAILKLNEIIALSLSFELKEVSKNIIKPKYNYKNKPLSYVLFEMILLHHPDKIIETYATDSSNILSLSAFADYFNNNQQKIISGLTKLYHKKNIHDDIKNIIHHMLFQNEPAYMKIFYELVYKNGFVALDIQHYAEKYEITHYLYTSNNITLNVFVPINNPNINLSLITRAIDIIRKLSNKPKTHVYLNIFNCKQFKYLPIIKNSIISPSNINTGSSQQDYAINIWRSEEQIKVIIHELIHYFNLDYNTDDALHSKISEIRNKYVIINGRDYVSETYTELLALTLHTLLISHLINIPFDVLMNYEICFSLFQTMKIINHFDETKLTYFDALKQKQIIFKQSTNVCSYFFVKMLFLFHYYKLLDFWEKTGFMFYVDDSNKQAYIKLYADIFENSFVGPGFERFMKTYEKLDFSANKKFVNKTLRMTLLEPLSIGPILKIEL
jgi:hypothetical protein